MRARLRRTVGVVAFVLFLSPPSAGADVVTPAQVEDVLRPVLARSVQYTLNFARSKARAWHASGVTPWRAANADGPKLVAFVVAASIALDQNVLDPTTAIEVEELLPILIDALSYATVPAGGTWPKQYDKGGQLHNLAYAAVLRRSTISDETFARVVAAVAYQASRQGVQYYRNKKGYINRIGDTRAEEDAWGTLAYGAALALTPPTDPRRALWEARYQTSTFATYARPSDVPRLFPRIKGSNIEEDGTLVNHGILPHVRYMRGPLTIVASLALLYSRLGLARPENLFFNADIVVAALVDLNFDPAAGWALPGGTIYRPGTWEIYYPAGDDAPTPSNVMQFALTDIIIWKHSLDSRTIGAGPQDFLEWAYLRAKRMASLQGPDGSVVPGSAITAPHEENFALQTALALDVLTRP
jgi:hypothetical protein